MTTAIIKDIEAQKSALLDQIKNLEDAVSILRARGKENLDLKDEIRAMHVEYNNLIDEIAEVKKSTRRQAFYDRKNKQNEAFFAGIEAYWEAHENKTYVPVCKFRQKYMIEAWEKGLKETENNYGCIDRPVYAA